MRTAFEGEGSTPNDLFTSYKGVCGGEGERMNEMNECVCMCICVQPEVSLGYHSSGAICFAI